MSEGSLRAFESHDIKISGNRLNLARLWTMIVPRSLNSCNLPSYFIQFPLEGIKFYSGDLSASRREEEIKLTMEYELSDLPVHMTFSFKRKKLELSYIEIDPLLYGQGVGTIMLYNLIKVSRIAKTPLSLYASKELGPIVWPSLGFLSAPEDLPGLFRLIRSETKDRYEAQLRKSEKGRADLEIIYAVTNPSQPLVTTGIWQIIELDSPVTPVGLQRDSALKLDAKGQVGIGKALLCGRHMSHNAAFDCRNSISMKMFELQFSKALEKLNRQGIELSFSR